MKLFFALILIAFSAFGEQPGPKDHAVAIVSVKIYPLRGCKEPLVLGQGSEVLVLSYGFNRYNATVAFKEKVSKIVVLNNTESDGVNSGCLALIKTINLDITAQTEQGHFDLKKHDLAMTISDTQIFGSQGCNQEGRLGFMSDVEILSSPIPHAFRDGSGTMVRVVNNTSSIGVKKECKGVVYTSELMQNLYLEKK